MMAEDVQTRLNAIDAALKLNVRNWLEGISVEADDVEIDLLVTDIEARVLAAMTGPLPE